jgi:bifunctional non-homologous end joining protein LigD
MLARSGPIPTRGDWSFEVKWDGFRGLLTTEHGLRIRSRRGWDMTELVPELASFPTFGIFDGQLVSFDSTGAPDFPLICERLLNRRPHIHLTYVIFDVLSLHGESLMRAPYSERRAQLEALDLNGVNWRTPEAFDDGEALFEAVCERELEGIVAKRRVGRYQPGERGWIKIKNRDYWRCELERESALNKRRARLFV